MNREDHIRKWLAEQEIAQIKGWDFSHIDVYHTQDELPWDYKIEILNYLKPEHKILDLDTGGGEFLLSLQHPYVNTAATENYPPNVALCSQTLLPLGIDFKQADAKGELPYADESFDIVLDRHGDFNAKEICRVLKPGGIFITQQVGAENDRELVEALLGDIPLSFPDQYLPLTKAAFESAGFTVLDTKEAYPMIRFTDIGALVWFARIISWEFVGFAVEKCLPQLFALQEKLEKDGEVNAKTHRYMLIGRK